MSGRYSNQSGSRYSHSRPPRNDVPPSLNGSYVKSNLPPNNPNYPVATSQAAAPPIQQNSLLNYFSESHDQVTFLNLFIKKKQFFRCLWPCSI